MGVLLHALGTVIVPEESLIVECAKFREYEKIPAYQFW